MWDNIIIANHELRGTSILNNCRERVVVDIQPFNDKIHSGYPIVISYGILMFQNYQLIVNSR